MKYKDLTLSDGRQVRVYVPPSIKYNQLLEKKYGRLYPEPQPPIVESETVGGGTVKMVIEDDPEYLATKAEMARKREEGVARELEDLTILGALKDVQPPDDWDVEEYGELARLADDEWQPRAGRKAILDYIEFDLLANPADAVLVQATLAELQGIDLEAIDQIEASFRGDMAQPTD